MKYLLATCEKSGCSWVEEEPCPLSNNSGNVFIDLANVTAWQMIETRAQAHVLATEEYGHVVEIHMVIRA